MSTATTTRTLRLGLLGMGQRTCHHGPAMFSNCRDLDFAVAAVCDNRPERLERGRQMYESEFGARIEGYLDYERMFDQADLDSVFIAGPNHLHRDMTLAALKRGIHVLCEKPMEINLGRCDEMIDAAKRADRILAVAMQMQYRQRYHTVKDLIDQGAIGKVAQVSCTEYRGPFGAMKDWVWDKRSSGGAIVEKNCHHYDIMDLWVQSAPRTVYASGNILKHAIGTDGRSKSQIIDNAYVINDYENGARGMISICFLAEPRMAHYREFGIFGTAGRIFLSNQDREVIHLHRPDGTVEQIRADGEVRGGMEADFINCINSGSEPLASAQRGRNSLLIPLAAEKSLDEGRIVHVRELA